MSTPEVQRMAESRLSQYFNGVNPTTLINPGVNNTVTGQSVMKTSPNMGINSLYGYLPSFEQTGRAYNQSGEPGAAAISQGTNFASHAIRDYLSSQIPKTAQIANNIYSGVSKIQPGAQKFAKYTIPSILGYQIFKSLIDKIKGQ
jgi:hypothetical protein